MEIILIRFNLPEKEKECIDSVKKYTNLKRHKLTVYDNYPLQENLAVVWNRLIEESTEDIICLLNNDTVVEEGWTKMIEVLDEKVGAVGPVTNNCGGRQKNMPKGQVEEINDLSGFCYLFRKEVWEEVGKFPEDMPFYGQETVFNRKLEDRGYKLMVDRRVYIHHYKAQSYKKALEKKELTNIEQELGAFHYWNFINRLKKLRAKIPQGTKLAILGGGKCNQFPLHKGMEQAINDFFGSNGLLLGADSNTQELKDFKPDIFISSQTGGYKDNQLKLCKEAKEQGCKMILYFCDLRYPSMIVIPGLELFEEAFICNGRLKEWEKQYNLKAYYLPQASIQHPKPVEGKKSRVLFVGSIGKNKFHAGRKDLCEYLGVTVNNCSKAENRDKRLEIQNNSYGDYHSSTFSLAISPDEPGYTSDRLYNIMGAGGCALSFNPGKIPFEHGKHLLWFRTKEEAKKLLATPKVLVDEIKENAFEEVQKNHTYKDRLIEILCNTHQFAEIKTNPEQI